MTAEPDRYYVERCLDGHPEDFCHLIRRYQRPLLASIRFHQRCADLAEEVAQEALVRAFQNLARLQKPESFFAWVVGIAQRVLLEARRRERRERIGIAQIASEQRNAVLPATPESGDPALEAALADLPAPFREVVLLRFYGECSCREVADRLGIPLGTVTKRLSRAYEELRRSLEADSRR
jgi:RNA polymerase sigma-70 factor (ECF subfamily)